MQLQPNYAPLSVLESFAARQLPLALGYFAARTRVNTLDGCPVAAMQMAVDTKTLRLVACALWKRNPTPEEESQLGEAIAFAFGAPMPVISTTQSDEGKTLRVGAASEVPDIVN